MSDSYQAVYDAVRSRISGCDIGSVIQEAIRGGFDASRAIESIRQEFCIAGNEMQRPSVLFRPQLSIDGNQWRALYGENLEAGVCGFGDTPAAAMTAFDLAWNTQKAVSA